MSASSEHAPNTLPAIVDNIPQRLRQEAHWVNWAWIHRGDRWTKMPVCPETGEAAKPNDPATWSTFLIATDAIEQCPRIGFVFQRPEDPEEKRLRRWVCGVDLDGCRDPESGEIAEWAWRIIRAFNTYAELSPTGTGVKLFLLGGLPDELPDERVFWKKKVLADIEGMGGKPAAIEMYDDARYFAVTGQHLEGTPTELQERAEEFLSLQMEYAERYTRYVRPSAGAAPLHLNDQELLDVALRARNGDKVRRLFESGDTSDYSDDESNADFGLCSLLAWYTDDAAQLERLMRSSALYRPKWDERRPGGTWISSTIAEAMRRQPRGYTGRTSNGTSRHAGTSSNGSRPAASGDQAEALEIGGDHCTDMGNASRLARRHGARLRYSSAHGWLVYDGRRWERDEKQQVIELAKDAVRSIYGEAAETTDRERRKQLGDWAKSSEAASRIMAMVKLAESELPVKAKEMDSDPWTLNCLNGTVDLRTGDLHPHRPGDLITKLAEVRYDPHADCPAWERFLCQVTDGSAELVDYLQRWAGYCLTGDVSEQMLLFLYGMGANGKSTFLRVLIHLLGDYAAQAAPGLLLEKNNDRHPTEIAELMGKRLVVSVEVGEGKRMAEELLKQLTGGDRLKGRFMRQDFFEFDPQFKLLLAANHKPIIKGTDHAIWRRIPVIPFEVTFSDDAEPRKDPHLFDKLTEELPGILAWCVRGCMQWRQRRLAPPNAVLKATAAYRAEMDVLGNFIEDCCITNEAVWAKAGDLYATYKKWCEDGGERSVTQKAFGQALQERGFVSDRTKTCRRWLGIALRLDDSPDGGEESQPNSRMTTEEGAVGTDTEEGDAFGVTRLCLVTRDDAKSHIDILETSREADNRKTRHHASPVTKCVTDTENDASPPVETELRI